ncbi:hypothetical protein V8J88_14520 [Massilia sp. W12]|uniref:hypothetical protein n=1 Tax=Massilia sp. W12 TaxID=3126507 RepID=UPI0030CFF725
MEEYSVEINEWKQLQLHHLFSAYRKAKADCFYERPSGKLIEFAKYEENLYENLNLLLEKLHSLNESSSFSNFMENKPLAIAYPKTIKISTKESNSENNPIDESIKFFTSNTSEYIDTLCKTNTISPEFRIIGSFEIDTHILSALWINKIGHKFDAILSRNIVSAQPPHLPKPTKPAHAVPIKQEGQVCKANHRRKAEKNGSRTCGRGA